MASPVSSESCRGCWLRVLSTSGQVLLERHLDERTRVAVVKAEIERQERLLPDRQLLLADGVPLGDLETLGTAAASGDKASRSACLEIQLRQVEPEWGRLLQDLSQGRESFEAARARCREECSLNKGVVQRHNAGLVRMTEDLRSDIEAALKRIGDSGAQLLAAAGDLQRNRDAVFEVVPRSSKGCRQAAEELMLCRSSVLASVQSNGQVLQSIAAMLLPAQKEVARALHRCAAAVYEAREAWRREGELLRFSKARGWLFADAAEDLSVAYTAAHADLVQSAKDLEAGAQAVISCRQAYRRAIIENRSAIKQAEASLQRDKEVIFAWAVDHVSDGRKADRQFIMTVVEGNGEFLERVPEEFRHDRELVLVAVTQSNGWALQWAAEELRHDREIVMSAVRRNGWALEHAAKELRGDRAIVLSAVQAHGEALDFADPRFKQDCEVVLTAIRRSGGWALQGAGSEVKGNREVAKAAIQQNSLLLEHVSEALRGDEELVRMAVQANGLALEHASPALRQDRNLVLTAVRSNPGALRFASARLQNDREVVGEAIQKDGHALRFASPGLRGDRKIVKQATEQGGTGVLQYAAPEMHGDPQLVALGATSSSRIRREGARTAVAAAQAAQGREPEDGQVTTWTLSREGPETVQL